MIQTTAICYRSIHKIRNNCSVTFVGRWDTMSALVEAMS